MNANTISGLLYFVGFLPYIWAIINHSTVPSPISWMIWVSVDTLTLVAMKKKGSDTGMLTGGLTGACIVTVLAIFFGKPTMGVIEWISIAGALLGITLWRKTGDAKFGIICAQATTFIGAFPTIAHGWQHPEEENLTAWVVWLVSCGLGLLAIHQDKEKKWDVANALQPLTFTAVETIMVLIIVMRPHLR